MKPAKEMTNSELVAHVKKLHKAQVCHDFELLLANRIEQLEQQRRWIPISESLPDDGEPVLVKGIRETELYGRRKKPSIGLVYWGGAHNSECEDTCYYGVWYTDITEWKRI